MEDSSKMARKNKDRKRRIPNLTPVAGGLKIPNQPFKTLRDDVNANELNPRFSFLFFDKQGECISKWTSEETIQLFDQLQHMCKMTWQQVIESGGKAGSKTGVGFTNIRAAGLKRGWPINLSGDAQMSEFRVCQKKRVFGVRKESTFYIVWLDRNHSVARGKHK